MTDTTAPTPNGAAPSADARTEDKTLPVAVYVLHLLFFATGVTPLIALIMAYAARNEPPTWRDSHYTFAIWTFWIALAASAAAWTMIGVGVLLSVIIVGIVPLLLGLLLLAATAIWFAVRCGLGLVYAMRAEPYPRPRNLII